MTKSTFDAQELATKRDIEALKLNNRLDILDVADWIAPIKTDLAVLKWMMGILIAGVLSIVIKTFF